jgi:hypothetical protein
MYQFMGPRRILPRNLPPGETMTLASYILPPGTPGSFLVELDLAAEGAGWFGAHGKPGPQIPVEVLASRGMRYNGDLAAPATEPVTNRRMGDL